MKEENNFGQLDLQGRPLLSKLYEERRGSEGNRRRKPFDKYLNVEIHHPSLPSSTKHQYL
jgi:hypothetical protein